MSNDDVSVTTDNHGNPISLKIHGTLHPIAEVIDAVERLHETRTFGVPVKEIPYSLLGERILIRGKAYSASEIADMAERAPQWRAQSEALVAIAEKLGIASWKVVPDRVVFAVESLHAAVDCIADLLDVAGWETDPASVASAVENLHTKAERITGMIEHAPKWRAQSEALSAIAGLLGVEGWEINPSDVVEAVELDRPEVERVRNLEGLKQILDLELPFIKGALKPWHINDVGDVAQAIKLMRGSYEERIKEIRAAKGPHHPTLLALAKAAGAWMIAQQDAEKMAVLTGVSVGYHQELLFHAQRRVEQAYDAMCDAIEDAAELVELEPSKKEAEGTGEYEAEFRDEYRP